MHHELILQVTIQSTQKLTYDIPDSKSAFTIVTYTTPQTWHSKPWRRVIPASCRSSLYASKALMLVKALVHAAPFAHLFLSPSPSSSRISFTHPSASVPQFLPAVPVDRGFESLAKFPPSFFQNSDCSQLAIGPENRARP
jgi:hypothetical protein